MHEHRTPLWSATAALLTILFAAPLTAQSTRPNLILLTSDDHRWDALGAAGNPKVHTPALDRLAARGAYFRQATTPVSQCHPVRATLLTGLAAHQHGALSNHHSLRTAGQPTPLEKLATLPGLLQAAGYHTMLVGKWHLDLDPWKAGFDDVATWIPGSAADYHDPEVAKGRSRDVVKLHGNTQEILGDDAVRLLENSTTRDKPFFLWLAFTAPHVPLEPNSPAARALYQGKTSAELLPPGFPSGIPSNDFLHYSEAVSDLDAQVARVVAALERTGLAATTTIVFLGDNGHMMGERGIGAEGVKGKIVPYESSVRVPMVLAGPGISPRVSDLPASSLDVPPTLLALARLTAPPNWPGRNLLGAETAFDDAFLEWADEVDERWEPFRAVRTTGSQGSHKLIVWKDAKKPIELYDLAADPAEAKNLAAKSEAQKIRADLMLRLKKWLDRTEDPARGWGTLTP